MRHIDRATYISPYTIIPSRLFVFNLSSWDAIFHKSNYLAITSFSWLSDLFFLCRSFGSTFSAIKEYYVVLFFIRDTLNRCDLNGRPIRPAWKRKGDLFPSFCVISSEAISTEQKRCVNMLFEFRLHIRFQATPLTSQKCYFTG